MLMFASALLVRVAAQKTFVVDGSQYALGQRLGEGSLGCVFAVDAPSPGAYVLKVLDAAKAKHFVQTQVVNSYRSAMMSRTQKMKKLLGTNLEGALRDVIFPAEVGVLRKLGEADPVHFVRVVSSGPLEETDGLDFSGCDSVQHDKGLFGAVLERAPHGDLDGLLRRGPPLPWEERLQLAADVAGILATLHEHKSQLVFPDFNPSQVLVFDREGGGKLGKVGDVGEVCYVSESPGSPFRRMDRLLPDGSGGELEGLERKASISVLEPYRAPECYGSAPVSPASDVFAAGVVAYQLLVGQDERRKRDENIANGQSSPQFPHPFLERRAAEGASATEELLAAMEAYLGREVDADGPVTQGPLPCKPALDKLRQRWRGADVAKLLEQMLAAEPGRRPSAREAAEQFRALARKDTRLSPVRVAKKAYKLLHGSTLRHMSKFRKAASVSLAEAGRADAGAHGAADSHRAVPVAEARRADADVCSSDGRCVRHDEPEAEERSVLQEEDGR